MTSPFNLRTVIIGIDPGPKESGVAEFFPDTFGIGAHGIHHNGYIEEVCGGFGRRGMEGRIFAIEMMASYGMAVGESVFQTCVQIGRFEKSCVNSSYQHIFRKEVKLALCGTLKAKDTNIKQSIVDMYGGKEIAIGGKKCTKCKGKGWSGAGRPKCTQCCGSGWKFPPGPLFGVKEHAWSALAVALTYAIKAELVSPSVVNPGGLCKSCPLSSRDVSQGSQTESPIRQDDSS